MRIINYLIAVIDWPRNLSDINPKETLWSIVKKKIIDTRLKNEGNMKTAVRAPCSIAPQQCDRLIASMTR